MNKLYIIIIVILAGLLIQMQWCNKPIEKFTDPTVHTDKSDSFQREQRKFEDSVVKRANSLVEKFQNQKVEIRYVSEKLKAIPQTRKEQYSGNCDTLLQEIVSLRDVAFLEDSLCNEALLSADSITESKNVIIASKQRSVDSLQGTLNIVVKECKECYAAKTPKKKRRGLMLGIGAVIGFIIAKL